MTESNENEIPEPTTDDEYTPEELAEEQSVLVDAMTGELVPASEMEEEPGGVAVAVDAGPPRVGMSPELHMDPYGEEQLDVSREEFEALLGEFAEDFQDIREGEIVNARVLSVTDSAVILEFGFKSEGSVALDEFKEAPKEGEEVEVLLEHLEDDDGIVVLSKKKADFLRVWEKIKEAHEADRPVKGTLVRKIKGGVTVDLMGVDAFLPGSQIALRRVPNIEDLIGEIYNFKIIKLNKRRRNIVVSRRVILETEREKKRETLVKELLVGQVREGVVKNITDFGAFIDLGGLDGLLHITDMSWGRVGHPSEVVDIGAELDVKVLDVDWDRERISLGLKQLLPYPWTDIDKKYPVGSRVRGKVVSITNYGAFIELEKGVEGLVHISEMSWTRNIRHPSKLVSIGDEIEAVVLKVDPDDEKISLGMKQIEEDPWLALPLKYPTGTNLAGTVRNLTSFGAFVEIEPGIDGLVHVSDMSWTKRVEHPSEIVQKGEEVDVMVLDVDAENKRISLGLKQLQDDPWPGISERLAPGVELEGTVARVQDKGVVMDLGDDIEGFVPGSHAAIEDPSRLDDYYREGVQVSLKVVESDAANRRIVLEVTEEPEQLPPRAEEDEAESAEERAEGEVEGVDAEADEAPEAGADEAPEAEADEAPEAEADEAPEAEADEAPVAEADEAPVAEADEAPEVEADEAPEAEADEAPEAEADEAPEAEADEAPEAEADDAPEAEADESPEGEPAEADEADEVEGDEDEPKA
jgi:small subunit ribosomal protein S1